MIIATRTLYIRDASGETPVTVTMTAPFPHPKYESCLCTIRIVWPDYVSEMNIDGADAFQALDYAQKAIGAILYSSSYHRDGVLFADYRRGGYGFPVTPNIRDVLVGEDAVFL
jgi:hypothetical protein